MHLISGGALLSIRILAVTLSSHSRAHLVYFISFIIYLPQAGMQQAWAQAWEQAWETCSSCRSGSMQSKPSRGQQPCTRRGTCMTPPCGTDLCTTSSPTTLLGPVQGVCEYTYIYVCVYIYVRLIIYMSLKLPEHDAGRKRYRHSAER